MDEDLVTGRPSVKSWRWSVARVRGEYRATDEALFLSAFSSVPACKSKTSQAKVRKCRCQRCPNVGSKQTFLAAPQNGS